MVRTAVVLMTDRRAQPGARDAGPANGSLDNVADTQRIPHSQSRHYLDLRNLFDEDLTDLEARYRWLAQQPDLDYERDTRALLRLWLDDIAAEWRRRERLGLKGPMPDYGIPKDLIRDIKEQTDCVRLIADDVPLTQRGRAHVGLCPFHDDRRPSLTVWPDGWHCFGCRVGGDAIAWLQVYQRVTFAEAVRWLCGLLGQPIPEREQRRVSRLRTREVRRAG